MQRETDGSVYYGPACRCGSRATCRVEGQFMVRRCSSCHGTYYYRLYDGALVTLNRYEAQHLDESRRGA